jgi:hypothetical protein
MHTLRKNLSWLFAFTSLACLQIAFSITLRTISEQHTFRLLLLLAPSMNIAFALIFGMAWWTVFKGKRSARSWGIAASLINILVGLFPLAFPPHSIWNVFLVMLAVGVAGLVAFGRRFEEPAPVASQQGLKLPGDGTNHLLNKLGPVLILIAGVAIYHWWLGWVRDREVGGLESGWSLALVGVLLGLAVAALHELGHAATGLALGMKLRAFIVGPFQWRVRDGKWEFQFDLKQILGGGGATGAVPATVDFSRGAQLFMTVSGVFVNLVTGMFALWVAFVARDGSPGQAGALLALFGAWNLVLGAINLVPFRAGASYSDGAQIYQLLSNGPWADFHRAFTVAGSSLVTPLRPRDHDIQAILRAGRTINQGSQGLLLRLLAYNYFLDQDRIPEAGEALAEAGLIYHESAQDIPAELFTPFVFGSAYIWRDASAARQWWAHLEAKKPIRFNADYWMAASALHWIEGNLTDANESWEKANTLAQQLPKAGAYEFDRHCCSLLRQAFDEIPVAK